MTNLPKHWLADLEREKPKEHVRAALSPPKTQQWLKERPSGEMCAVYQEQVLASTIWLAEKGADGAYDYTRDVVWGLVRDAASGHSGVVTALEVLRRAYLAEVSPRREEKKASSEWNRFVADAVRKTVADAELEPADSCPCALVAGWGDAIEAEDGPGPVEKLAAKYEREIRARKLAQERIAAADWERPPEFESLADQLKTERPTQVFAIESLAAANANVLLIAQWKAGKTTLLLNLLKAAVDGIKFLDQYQVNFPADSTIAYFNMEVDKYQMAEWLEEMEIANPGRLYPVPLRGWSVPLTHKEGEDWAVERLMSVGAKWWFVDPIGTIYEGEENSNSEKRDFQKALDRIKRRAGIELLVAAEHTGNSEDNAMRARGAARNMDWADVFWNYRHAGKVGDIPGKDTRRWLTAFGRDINEPETALEYDSARRWTYVDTAGVSRAESRITQLAEKAYRIVFDHTGEPLNAGRLKDKLGLSGQGTAGTLATGAIAYAVEQGWLDETPGKQNSKLYTRGEASPDMIWKPSGSSGSSSSE